MCINWSSKVSRKLHPHDMLQCHAIAIVSFYCSTVELPAPYLSYLIILAHFFACNALHRRYQLLVAFLPLTSAISGNVGLQASTLTTRAVSHLQIAKHSYCIWLYKEIVAAAYQGFAMGAISGIFAYIASGHDAAFSFAIFLAQFSSILTAGLTGTLAPLIFTFVFRRDSGQWGGPLETAIQDIVGSFAMVILSYHVLNLLGPHEISESDMC